MQKSGRKKKKKSLWVARGEEKKQKKGQGRPEKEWINNKEVTFG